MITFYITTNSFQVLWNEEMSKNFSPSRGIRQGDRILAYIYILYLERLADLIGKKVEQGRWKPMQLVRKGPKLSQMSFADDLVLFTEASIEQIDVVN